MRAVPTLCHREERSNVAIPMRLNTRRQTAVATTLQAMQSRTQSAVADLRGIDNPPPVETSFRTREELCEITLGFYRRRNVRDQLFEAEELYKTLGLMAEHLSLEDILLGIQLQHVSALFDDASGNVYVLSDAAEITPSFELGYAAAYMSGLQQALFDVVRLRDDARRDTADRFRAVTGLITGDVAVVAGGYEENVIADDPAALDALQAPTPNNQLSQAPDIVRKTVLFPLNQGRGFVLALYDREDGWPGVDEAYREPPASSEQVLHPSRYFAGELPQIVTVPDISDAMSPGWSLTATDTMGEFLLKSYLEAHLSEAEAGVAAAGWGGDQYVLMSNPELGPADGGPVRVRHRPRHRRIYRILPHVHGPGHRGRRYRLAAV